MKRAVVWIDVRDEDAEEVIRKLKESLDKMRLSLTVVDVSKLNTVEDTH